MLIVLHDLNLASTFADRIVLLVNGRVIAQGQPSEVISHKQLSAIYGDSITVFPRPDGNNRPAVLPSHVDNDHELRSW